MADCSEALLREIFLHTQCTADMSYSLDTLVKPLLKLKCHVWEKDHLAG